jgi:hypothetical protein
MKSSRPKIDNTVYGMTFNSIFQSVVLQQQDQFNTIRGKVIGANSKFYAKLTSYIHKSSNNESGYFCYGTFFNGGTLFVNPEHLRNAYDSMGQDIDSGVLLCFNEMVPVENNGFRMFVDMDFKTMKILPTIDEIVDLTSICQETVKNSFDNNVDAKVMILLSSPKPVFGKTAKDHRIKVGVHIVFPNVIVNYVSAITIADRYIALMAKKYPQFVSAIDTQPYKRTTVSLRAPYNHKVTDCFSCQRSIDMPSCNTCKGSGRCIEPSVYIPGLYYDNDFKCISIKSMSTATRYRCSSILPWHGQTITTGCRVQTMPSILAINNNDGARYVSEQRRLAVIANSGITVLNSDDYRVLFELFARAINSIPTHRELVVRDMKHDEERKFIYINVVGDTQKMCRILGGGEKYIEHHSNRISFRFEYKLQKQYLRQCCFDKECSKNAKLKHIKSKIVVPLSDDVRRAICRELNDKRGSAYILPSVSDEVKRAVEKSKLTPEEQCKAKKWQESQNILNFVKSFTIPQSKKRRLSI